MRPSSFLTLITGTGLLLVALCSPGQAGEPPTGAVTQDQTHVVFKPRHRSLLSVEVPGTITDVHYETGESFKKGDVLISLDDTIYAANLLKTKARLKSIRTDLLLLDKAIPEANLTKAEAKLESLRTTMEAKESLFKDDAISKSELGSARAAVKMAEADVAIAKIHIGARDMEVAKVQAQIEAAEADILISERQVKACSIIAPHTGKVVKLHGIHEYATVQAGQPVIEILDDRIVLAQFFVPTSRFRSLRIGQEVKINVRELSADVTGKVSHISAEANPVTGMVTVFAEVENRVLPDGKSLLSGGWRGLLDLAHFDEQ